MRLAPLLLLAACGLPEDDFVDGTIQETCRLLVTCPTEGEGFLEFESESDCRGFLRLFGAGSAGEGCDYSARAAKTCLDAFEAMTCEEYLSGADRPSVCDDVYTGDCEWTQPADTSTDT